MNEQPAERFFSYEKLDVWQDARGLIRDVYQLTSGFPSSEKFGLVSQLNRAMVSVACNLAEGSARTSSKDQAHFSQLSFSSLMEPACLLTIAQDLNYADALVTSVLRERIHFLSSRINKLRQSQLNRAASN
jgi:four helix bundle protein